jgi:hypothetical protein
MLNAERILTTLDGKLDHEVSLALYGRAAIALGFEDAPPETGDSLDVDAIIRWSQASLVDEDMQFWDAHRATNEELKDLGLYMTHLYMETQVFLRRSWESHSAPEHIFARMQEMAHRLRAVDLDHNFGLRNGHGAGRNARLIRKYPREVEIRARTACGSGEWPQPLERINLKGKIELQEGTE